MLAQFTIDNTINRKDKPISCAGCQLKLKCLKDNETLSITGLDGKEWRIASWEDLCLYLENAGRDHPTAAELELVMFVKGSNVCPIPFFSDLSLELFRLFSLCGETRLPFSGGVADQPAIYVQAMEIFQHEQGRAIKEIQQSG